jgi:hypothetical protein
MMRIRIGRGRVVVKRADPQLRDGLIPLAVLLAIGVGLVGVGLVGVGLVGVGLVGVGLVGVGLVGAGLARPGVVGLPILAVSLTMMRTPRMTPLPFNQTVRLEFILIGKSCGEL